jgi:hypothetical protein
MSTQPADPAANRGDGDVNQLVNRASLFGGNGLISLGALIVLFAFMLPWASCGNLKLSGLDIVTQSSRYSQYGDGSSWGPALALVPLGAMALLALGVGGILVGLVGKSLPQSVLRLMPFMPLVAALPGLCSCCPSGAFLFNLQSARSDPESLGLGMMIQIEYGFWLTLVGLGVSFIGIVAAVVGGLMARRQTPGISIDY